MNNDLITNKAIILRDIIYKIERQLSQVDAPTFADKYLLTLLDKACKACISLANQYCYTQYKSYSHSPPPPHVFQQLVDSHIIDQGLSRRLLSLIAFRKLIEQAALLKGKQIQLKLTPAHLQDFHTFTQKILLA